VRTTKARNIGGAANFVAARSAEIRRAVEIGQVHVLRVALDMKLREFHSETEQALGKVLEVMCAHEAEVAGLRRQLSELSSRSVP
jgi:hypothetical protein